VFDDDDVEGVLLRNCVNVDTLADPVAAAHAVLSRCTPQDLMMIYALPRCGPTPAPEHSALHVLLSPIRIAGRGLICTLLFRWRQV
jgi:hypothetical protein